MMLDLIVQAAEREVGEPAAPDVAGGQHLPTQEVMLIFHAQDGHAFVVGAKDAPRYTPNSGCSRSSFTCHSACEF